jgi:hypothetical protein
VIKKVNFERVKKKENKDKKPEPKNKSVCVYSPFSDEHFPPFPRPDMLTVRSTEYNCDPLPRPDMMIVVVVVL